MSQARSDPVTVLHVDDEPGFCAVVADFLEQRHGWLEVRTATDAAEGLDRVQTEDIDCVVSDYDMPGTNGLDFLQSIREWCPDLPFILYTGKGSEEIASEAISAGVDDYLQKETATEQYDVLAKRIRNVVDRERARTAAADADERYHNLIDTAPVPIMLFDTDADVVYANEAARDFLEAEDLSELDDVTMPELLVGDDRETARKRFERLFERDEPLAEIEFRIRALDGTVKRAIVATAPGTYQDMRVAQAIARQVVEE